MSLGDEYVKQAQNMSEMHMWYWDPNTDKKSESVNNLYKKAIEQYNIEALRHKINHDWSGAGHMFNKIAELYSEKLNDNYLTALNYTRAGDMFQKVDEINAILIFEKSISPFLLNGNFNSAAQNSLTIATLAENNNLIERAILYYQNAYKYYTEGYSETNGMIALEKAGILLINSYKYGQASIIFEKAATHYMRLSINQKYRSCLFDTFMCKIFVDDLKNTKTDLLTYNNLQSSFTNSKEYIFLDALISALECKNIDECKTLFVGYDENNPLHQYHHKIFISLMDRIEVL